MFLSFGRASANPKKKTKKKFSAFLGQNLYLDLDFYSYLHIYLIYFITFDRVEVKK